MEMYWYQIAQFTHSLKSGFQPGLKSQLRVTEHAMCSFFKVHMACPSCLGGRSKMSISTNCLHKGNSWECLK